MLKVTKIVVDCVKIRNMKRFYRVENPTTKNGLWYDKNGHFTGVIHKEKFKELQNNNLPMPYNSEIVNYLSVAESLEDLDKWFNEKDMDILKPYGYVIAEYESDDYKIVENHYVMNKFKAKRLRTL